MLLQNALTGIILSADAMDGESSILHNARGTTVRHHGGVTRLEMADENTLLRGDWPIQSKYRSMGLGSNYVYRIVRN